eukprot:GEMP01000797.1.p1 GENE.GEMP01000797.1~~GEMP01000797.1.p1  ORF type:complete len:1651 (+),score=280.49 GEMP01000797.1:164-4954(+)
MSQPHSQFTCCAPQSQQYITPTPPSQPPHHAVQAHHVMNEPVVMSQPIPLAQQPVQGRVISSQGPKTPFCRQAPPPPVVYATSSGVQSTTISAEKTLHAMDTADDNPTRGGNRHNGELQWHTGQDHARGEEIRSLRPCNSNASEEVAGPCNTAHNATHCATARYMPDGDAAVQNSLDVFRNNTSSTKADENSCVHADNLVRLTERLPTNSTSLEKRPGYTSGTTKKRKQLKNADQGVMDGVDNLECPGALRQEYKISDGPSHFSNDANVRDTRQNAEQKQTTLSKRVKKMDVDAEETTRECTTFEPETDVARTVLPEVSEQLLTGGNVAFERCNPPKTTHGDKEPTQDAALSKNKPVVELGGTTQEDVVLDNANITTTTEKKVSLKPVDVKSRSTTKRNRQKGNGTASQKTTHAPTCLPTNPPNDTFSQENVFTARHDAACDSLPPLGKGASKRQRHIAACTESSAWKIPRVVHGLPYAFVEGYSWCFTEWRREDHFRMLGYQSSKGSQTVSTVGTQSSNTCSYSSLKQEASQSSPNAERDLLLSMPSIPSDLIDFDYLSVQSKPCSPLCTELFSPYSEPFDVQIHGASDIPRGDFMSPAQNKKKQCAHISSRQQASGHRSATPCRGRSSPPCTRNDYGHYTRERVSAGVQDVGVSSSDVRGRLCKRSCKERALDDTQCGHDQGARPRAEQKVKLRTQSFDPKANPSSTYDTSASDRLADKMQRLRVKSEYPSQQSQNNEVVESQKRNISLHERHGARNCVPNSIEQQRYGRMIKSERPMNKLQRERTKSADPCMLQRNSEGSREQAGSLARSHRPEQQLQRRHTMGNVCGHLSRKCDAKDDGLSSQRPINKLKKERARSPEPQIFNVQTGSHLAARKFRHRHKVENIEAFPPCSHADADRKESQGQLSSSQRPMNKLQRMHAKIDDYPEIQNSVPTTSQHVSTEETLKKKCHANQLRRRHSVTSVINSAPQVHGIPNWMDVSPAMRQSVPERQEQEDRLPCQVPGNITQRCKIEHAIQECSVGSPQKCDQRGKLQRPHSETPDVLMSHSAENSQRSFQTNPASVRPMNKLQQHRAKSANVVQQRAKRVDIARRVKHNTPAQARCGHGPPPRGGASMQRMEDIKHYPEEPGKQKPSTLKDVKNISPVLRHVPHCMETHTGLASGHGQHVLTVPGLPAYESRPQTVGKVAERNLPLASRRRSSTVCPSTLFSPVAKKPPSKALSHKRVSAAHTPQLRSSSIALPVAPKLAPRYPRDTMRANMLASSRSVINPVPTKRSAGDSTRGEHDKKPVLTGAPRATDFGPPPCSKLFKNAPSHKATLADTKSNSSDESNGNEETWLGLQNAKKSEMNEEARNAQRHKSAKIAVGVKTETRADIAKLHKYLESSSASSIRSTRTVGDALKPGIKVKSTSHKTRTHGKPHVHTSPPSAKIDKPRRDETISMESILESIRRRATTKVKATPQTHDHSEGQAPWCNVQKENAATSNKQDTTAASSDPQLHGGSRTKVSCKLADLSSSTSTLFGDDWKSPVATDSTRTTPSTLFSISSTHLKSIPTKAVPRGNTSTITSTKCVLTAVNSKKRKADFAKEGSKSKKRTN